MTDNDPPVAADDFPEFGEPPRQIPPHARESQKPSPPETAGSRQAEVDAVIARLRRARAAGADAEEPADGDAG